MFYTIMTFFGKDKIKKIQCPWYQRERERCINKLSILKIHVDFFLTIQAGQAKAMWVCILGLVRVKCKVDLSIWVEPKRFMHLLGMKGNRNYGCAIAGQMSLYRMKDLAY